MPRFHHAVLLVLLLVSLPGVANSTSSSSYAVNAESWLGWMIRDEVPPMPVADPCSPDFDQDLVDAYNDSLPRALARMLAAPEAQALTPDHLKTAYSLGTGAAKPVILVQGGDFVLAAIQQFQLLCAPGSRRIYIYNLYVANRAGDYWQIGAARSGFDGRFPFADIQWVGSRWLAVIAHDHCSTCFNIREIRQLDGAWLMESTLDIEGQWYNHPVLSVFENGQRIALDLQPRYLYTTPPCTFTPEIQEALYLSWQKIQRVYEWTETDTYEQVSERVLETHVLIDTPHDPGEPAYRELTDWERYCVD